MGLPQVAIVGRPNVGKSSIFNWLAGIRIAVVDDRPGVTRDRLSHSYCYNGRYFDIIDTGGMGIVDSDNLTEHIENQISIAINMADLILFVVDTRAGLTPLDTVIAQRLRTLDVPILLVANKTDADTMDTMASEFHKLGFNTPVLISTTQNRHHDLLLKHLVEELPNNPDRLEEPLEDPTMRVAVVGRRNVGKSTFINALVQEERMIVSEVAGTTRDSVDVHFELDNKKFIAIDTPGLRRTRSRKDDLDYYGAHRAQRSIRRADVTFMFFDSAEEISRVDKQLCDYIITEYKPCIFVVNKWDKMVDLDVRTEEWVEYLNDTFGTMRYVPIAFITAMNGKNIKTLVNHGQMLFKQSLSRISTGKLNRVVRDALLRNPPPIHQNRRPKIFFATQASSEPPTIILVCSNPKAFQKNYQRYLLSCLRDALDFDEIPIKLIFRNRSSTEERDKPTQRGLSEHENFEDQTWENEFLEDAENNSKVLICGNEGEEDVLVDFLEADAALNNEQEETTEENKSD